MHAALVAEHSMLSVRQHVDYSSTGPKFRSCAWHVRIIQTQQNEGASDQAELSHSRSTCLLGCRPALHPKPSKDFSSRTVHKVCHASRRGSRRCATVCDRGKRGWCLSDAWHHTPKTKKIKKMKIKQNHLIITSTSVPKLLLTLKFWILFFKIEILFNVDLYLVGSVKI